MKNIYGETVHPKYDVCLERNVGTRQEPEWSEDMNEVEAADNYFDAVRRAKKMSLKYPDNLEARVYIVCYFEDSISTFNQVWWEYYENGKKDERIMAD